MAINLLEILTNTELKVLQLIAHGYTYKEIAAEHGVQIDTIKKHCYNMYTKLNVSNKMQAVMLLNNYEKGDGK
jgi:two-component system, NarL family, response regulator LiaR